MADEEQFEGAESGASETFPKQCSAIKKGEHVVIKSRPCKVVEMSTSKTGKHGHAKVHLVALDIFTGKKYEDICPSTHNMNCPVVGRHDYTVIGCDGGFLKLMDDQGMIREDLKVPTDPDLNKEVKDMMPKVEAGDTFVVTVVKALGCEQVTGTKLDRMDKP